MNELVTEVRLAESQHQQEILTVESKYNDRTPIDKKLTLSRKSMELKITASDRPLTLTPKNISASNIHQFIKKDHNAWHDLGRGKAILSQPSHLEQYFYSYGPMISRQWSELRQPIKLNSGAIDIFDYGCGQGIGTANIFDHLRSGGKPSNERPEQRGNVTKGRLDAVRNVNLIEPSAIALSRAKELLDIYPTNSKLNCVNKRLNDLTITDLKYMGSSIKVHVFSNILDIGSFDQLALLEKILSIKGIHCIAAVSPKNSDGGLRMEDFCTKIVETYIVKSYKKWDLRYKTQIHNALVAYLEV